MNDACRTPANIAELLSKDICMKKATGKWWKLLILGFLAGAFIGFGGELATMIGLGETPIGVKKLLMGSVFSVGLMLVVIAGKDK